MLLKSQIPIKIEEINGEIQVGCMIKNADENESTSLLTDSFGVKGIRAGKGVKIYDHSNYIELETPVIESHSLKGESMYVNNKIKTIMAGNGIQLEADIDSITISVKQMETLLQKIDRLESRIDILERKYMA